MNYNLNVTSSLADSLSGKSVLIIPVYSMRDYITGLYDFACDGNYHIAMNLIYQLSADTQVSLAIPMPAQLKEQSVLRAYAKPINASLEYLSCGAYGKNALETRLNGIGWHTFIESLDVADYDLVLFSPQAVGGVLHSSGHLHCMYWLYHSRTEDYNPRYMEATNALDSILFTQHTTVIASYNQLRYFSGAKIDNKWYDIAYMNKVYETYLKEDVEAFKMPTIFIPFRQSHEGYLLEELFLVLERMPEQWDIYYSAPNNVVLHALPKYAVQVSPDKAEYIKLLRRKPLIPLLENVDDLLHYSMYEFVHLGAKLLTLPNGHVQAYDERLNLHHIDFLEASLKHIHKAWPIL